MSIEDALKDGKAQLRITNSIETKWLIWGQRSQKWEVYEEQVLEGKPSLIKITSDPEDAVKHLMRG